MTLDGASKGRGMAGAYGILILNSMGRRAAAARGTYTIGLVIFVLEVRMQR
jgi:hypothetical protein